LRWRVDAPFVDQVVVARAEHYAADAIAIEQLGNIAVKACAAPFEANDKELSHTVGNAHLCQDRIHLRC
jgi:hypothetical protein